MDEQSSFVPEWVDGKKINEALFCREFLAEHIPILRESDGRNRELGVELSKEQIETME